MKIEKAIPVHPGKPYPKFYFAKPGDVIRLFSDDGNLLPEYYLVTGLLPGMASFYGGKYMLVNVETGEPRHAPHVSERVERYPYAKMKPGSGAGQDKIHRARRRLATRKTWPCGPIC